MSRRAGWPGSPQGSAILPHVTSACHLRVRTSAAALYSLKGSLHSLFGRCIMRTSGYVCLPESPSVAQHLIETFDERAHNDSLRMLIMI